MLTGVKWYDNKYKENYHKSSIEDARERIVDMTSGCHVFAKGTDLEDMFLNGDVVNGIEFTGSRIWINDINEFATPVESFDVHVAKNLCRLCTPKSNPHSNAIIGPSRVPISSMRHKLRELFGSSKYAYMPPAHDPAQEIVYFSSLIENEIGAGYL
jgi:hypothetical protein